MPTNIQPDTVGKLEGALDYIRRLSKLAFWGSICLRFEAGRLVHVRREENLKPDELSEEQRFIPNGQNK